MKREVDTRKIVINRNM